MKVKGNGSIRPVKDKNGKAVKNSWQLVLGLGVDPITKKRIQKCRHFKGNKTQARRALEEFRREIEYGIKIDADKVTFDEYAQQRIDEREASGALAPATIKRDKDVLKHLKRYLHDVALKDIDAPTVRTMYVLFANDKLGDASINRAALVLKQILKQAVADDILIRNPCDSVSSPRQKKSNVSRALNQADVSKLIRKLKKVEAKRYPNAKSPRQKEMSNLAHTTAVRIILSTGLRQGEMLALSWNDVDFDSAILSVCHTLDKTTGKLKDPKTESGVRDVSLDPQILSHLRTWKAVQCAHLHHLGIAVTKKTPVITSDTGTHMTANNLSRWWRNFRNENGFEGLRLHDLRHTHATLLVSSGLNIKAISNRLGHANVGITLDLYAHAQRADDEKAAAIIGDILNEQREERSTPDNVVILQDCSMARKAN